MTDILLKKTVLFSLLGHIILFSIFSFTFGNKVSQADYSRVIFWGAVLNSADLMNQSNFNRLNIKAFMKRDNYMPLNKTEAYRLLNKKSGSMPDYYLKPQAHLAFKSDKIIFFKKTTPLTINRRRDAPAIMFYPHLPYHFLLYFKDRQAVHIELMFNVISSGRSNSILIKRKVSSGNLEADLLSMRYIGHYLFIQQLSFPQNNWQTVKIDLSEAKADRIE